MKTGDILSEREAIQLVLQKSHAASHKAIKALRSIERASVNRENNVRHAIEEALDDGEAAFTEAERMSLAVLLAGTHGRQTRTVDIRLRVTPEEKERVQEMAEKAGALTLSDYIREKIGLD